MDEEIKEKDTVQKTTPPSQNSEGGFSAPPKKAPPPPPPPRKPPQKPPAKPAEKPSETQKSDAEKSVGEEKSPKENSDNNVENKPQSDEDIKAETPENKDSQAQKSDEQSPESNEPSQQKDDQTAEEASVQPQEGGDEQFSEEEEEQIARLQCEDDDNGAGEVIEKNYKAGLSDQDRQRRRKKLRRLLLLLLLLLLLIAAAVGTYFLVKSLTDYSPVFYDNVDITLSRTEFKGNTNAIANDTIACVPPVVIEVTSDTEEINYDIVAFAIKITATLNDTLDDCTELIDVKFKDLSQIYRNYDIVDAGDGYIRCSKDLKIYYKKVLEPGQTEELIQSLRINGPTANNFYANRSITIKIEAVAVYPDAAQIRREDCELKDAPQEWIDDVNHQLEEIFKERKKRK